MSFNMFKDFINDFTQVSSCTLVKQPEFPRETDNASLVSFVPVSRLLAKHSKSSLSSVNCLKQWEHEKIIKLP